jgi:hypothetical protein
VRVRVRACVFFLPTEGENGGVSNFCQFELRLKDAKEKKKKKIKKKKKKGKKIQFCTILHKILHQIINWPVTEKKK